MCYTPQISLTTALIEFFMAFVLFKRFHKSQVRDYSIIILIFLGLYQLTEFFICTTNYANCAAKIGMLVYTFLPAIALDGILAITKNKKFKIFVYILPIIFSIAIMYKGFIISANCNYLTVTVINVINVVNTKGAIFLHNLYILYYSIFLFLTALGFYHLKRFEKNQMVKKSYEIFILGIIVMIVPTYLSIIIEPSLRIQLPSILCHFAVLFATLVFIGNFYYVKGCKKIKLNK